MTIAEAHQEYKTRLDKIDALEYPNVLPEEIDLIFNNAQDRYVKQRYGKTNPKRVSFEEEEKRTQDLRVLITPFRAQPLIPSSNSITSNAYRVNIEENQWFIVHEKAIINCPSCNTSITIINSDDDARDSDSEIVEGIEVEVRAVTHNEFEKIKNDPFKGPDYEKLLRVIRGNYIELIPKTGCTVSYYFNRYIRQPERVSLSGNVTFELPEHTHSEIIDEAIKITLENIESRRNSTFTPIIDNQKE